MEKIGEFATIAEIGFEDALAILVENGAGSVIKNDIAQGITTTDFAVEIIAGIFRFPITTRKREGVAESGVRFVLDALRTNGCERALVFPDNRTIRRDFDNAPCHGANTALLQQLR